MNGNIKKIQASVNTIPPAIKQITYQIIFLTPSSPILSSQPKPVQNA